MRIAQVGNFGPPHSTESHLARALGNIGHEVIRVQENVVDNWRSPGRWVDEGPGVDFVLWTRTGWDWPHYGISHEKMRDLQLAFLDYAELFEVPVIGYHLDRWWGLEREYQIFEEPFFRCDLVCTADGGHDTDWLKAGVTHAYYPPAVSRDEAKIGMFDPRFASPVSFVGSWRGYHREWQHRAQLVRKLQMLGAAKIKFWPQPGQPAVRGVELQNLYASVDVVVGDSCLVPHADGSPMTDYSSDRIPETLGRGGFLLHPRVQGVTDSLYTEGEHLDCWELGDWNELRHKIDFWLRHPVKRREVAAEGREHVLFNHTYERRMEQLIDYMKTETLL